MMLAQTLPHKILGYTCKANPVYEDDSLNKIRVEELGSVVDLLDRHIQVILRHGREVFRQQSYYHNGNDPILFNTKYNPFVVTMDKINPGRKKHYIKLKIEYLYFFRIFIKYHELFVKNVKDGIILKKSSYNENDLLKSMKLTIEKEKEKENEKENAGKLKLSPSEYTLLLCKKYGISDFELRQIMFYSRYDHGAVNWCLNHSKKNLRR